MSDIVPFNNDTPPPDPITALLIRASTDPNFSIEKFEALVRIRAEETQRQAHRAFNDAMAAAQLEMRDVPKDAKNDHLRSRYATLNSMLSTVLPAASRHGLNIRFGSAPASQPGWQCVTCIVSLGDHVETTSLEGPIVSAGAAGGRTQMTGIQATGSTTTYLKRYLIGMCFSLILTDEQDDDGEASRWPHQGAATPPSRPPVQETPREPSAPPRQTVGQWLDALALELAGCEGGEEVDGVLARADVQAAQDRLRNGAKDRMDHMIQEAIKRTANETTAPNIEPPLNRDTQAHAGIFADPDSDPFAERVPS